MVSRNELIPHGSGQADKAIQSPSHLTPSPPAKTKPAVFVRSREQREADGGNHGKPPQVHVHVYSFTLI
jgi:hypothetical protein